MDTAAEAFSEKGIFIPHQSYSKRGQHEVLKWAMSETLSQLKASFQRRIGVGPTQSAQSESAAEAKTKQFISQPPLLLQNAAVRSMVIVSLGGHSHMTSAQRVVGSKAEDSIDRLRE